MGNKKFGKKNFCHAPTVHKHIKSGVPYFQQLGPTLLDQLALFDPLLIRHLPRLLRFVEALQRDGVLQHCVGGNSQVRATFSPEPILGFHKNAGNPPPLHALQGGVDGGDQVQLGLSCNKKSRQPD